MRVPALVRADGPPGIILVRLSVGLVFLLEGVKKFLQPADWGAGRFTRIGIPHPSVMAPFVGIVEVVCGTLLVVGLATRLAAIPLLVDITVAIITTKIPILLAKGFWPMEGEARTDFAMLLGLLFLLAAGPGRWSFDAVMFASRTRHAAPAPSPIQE